jgi:hypothetical protein
MARKTDFQPGVIEFDTNMPTFSGDKWLSVTAP